MLHAESVPKRASAVGSMKCRRTACDDGYGVRRDWKELHRFCNVGGRRLRKGRLNLESDAGTDGFW